MTNSGNDADGLDAADAFSLLADPLRIDIVRVLYEAGRGEPVPFSELYDHIDVKNTGRFNYHRDELVPHFVRQTEDGYLLTEAGHRVARAVNAGTYTGSPKMEDFDVRGACYDCGATDLRGEYLGERFQIECRACDNRVLNVGVPPSVASERDPDDFVAAFEQWARSHVQQARDGLCPECGGPVAPGLSHPTRDTLDYDCQAVFDCLVCDRRVVTNFGSLAFWTDAVESFLRERDPVLADRPYWAVEQAMIGDGVELVSEEPIGATVEFPAAGEACRVTFGDDLSVVDVTVETVDDA